MAGVQDCCSGAGSAYGAITFRNSSSEVTMWYCIPSEVTSAWNFRWSGDCLPEGVFHSIHTTLPGIRYAISDTPGKTPRDLLIAPLIWLWEFWLMAKSLPLR